MLRLLLRCVYVGIMRVLNGCKNQRLNLAVGVCFWILTPLTWGQVSTRPQESGVLLQLEVASGWRLEAVAADGLLHWPTSLAFDWQGAVWIVEKTNGTSRLCRLLDTNRDGIFDRRQEMQLPTNRLTSVATWGDWLYLVGDGQLLRWRIGATDSSQSKETILDARETVLEGLDSNGPAFLSVSVGGVCLRCRGNAIRQPGRPVGHFPKSSDLILLVGHELGVVRLLSSSQASSIAPIAVDSAGNIWTIYEASNRQAQLFRWQTYTGIFSPIADQPTESDNASKSEGRLEAAMGDLRSGFTFGSSESGQRLLLARRAEKPLLPAVIGLVWDYRGQGDETQPSLLWAKAWPPALYGQTEKQSPRPLITAKSAYRTSVIFTALASDRRGNIYLAGCYRMPTTEVHGFLVRLKSAEPRTVTESPGDLSRLDIRQLLEHLARAEAAELPAIEEEIYRRGETVLPALVDFAESLMAEGNNSETALPTAAVRILRLLAALRTSNPRSLRAPLAEAVLRLGLKLLRHKSLELSLAGIALLSGDSNQQAQGALVQLLEDRELRLRQAAVLALAETGKAEVAAMLANLLRFYDGREPEWFSTLVRGLELCGDSGVAALWELASSGSASELASAISAWTRLCCPTALGYVGKWLDHPHLDAEQRCAILLWWSFSARQYPAQVRPILDWLARQVQPTPSLLAAGLLALAVQVDQEPIAISQFAAKWLEHEDLSVRLAAMSCLRLARDCAIQAQLLRRVQENARSPEERLLAAEVLLAQGSTEIQSLLLNLLADRSQTQALREQVAVLLLGSGDEAVRQQTLARLADWPRDMWHVVLLYLRPEKDILLTLAERYRQGSLIRVEVERPWYWRIANGSPSGLTDALAEALAVWCAEDPKAWQAVMALAQR